VQRFMRWSALCPGLPIDSRAAVRPATARRAPYSCAVRGLLVPFLPLACVVLLSGCSSPDKGFGESAEVGTAELGETWPLTVESAVLTCGDTGVASVTAEGRTTVIDASTVPRDVSSDFTRIWAQDASQPAGRMDLKPLVERAQELCD
jgi:hypothetical protein